MHKGKFLKRKNFSRNLQIAKIAVPLHSQTTKGSAIADFLLSARLNRSLVRSHKQPLGICAKRSLNS